LPKKDGGIRFEMVHDITPYGPEWQRFGEVVQQRLALVGIKATLRYEDVATWLKRTYTDYDFPSPPESGGSYTHTFVNRRVVTQGRHASHILLDLDPAARLPGPPGTREAAQRGPDYALPVPDGSYTVRLHFASPSNNPNDYKFDIKLNGTTVQSDYDVEAMAGGAFKATSLSFPVNASGGDGITLQLVTTGNGAILNGIELSQSASGVANPTVHLDYSSNNGSSYSSISGAGNLSMDRFGRGSFNWSAGPGTTSAGRIKVTGNQGAATPDASDGSFSIANAGSDYYIDDAGNTGDEFTPTATGNDLGRTLEHSN